MSRLFAYLLTLLAFAGGPPAVLAEECFDRDAADLVKEASTNLPREAIRRIGTAWLPAGSQVRINFTRRLPDADQLIFRILAVPTEDAEGDAERKNWRYYPVGNTGLGESGDGETVLGVLIPQSLGAFWGGRYRFYAIACGPGEGEGAALEPRLVVIGDASVRGWALAAIVAVLAVVLAYWLAGLATRAGNGVLTLANPLQIIRGHHGRASLSNLQILWFSLVVLGVSTYVLMRTGELTELSMDVVYLLGIAGLGTAAGKATATHRKRLSWDSWVLLEQLGLPVAQEEPPSMKDLVTEMGVFDVYKFQMLAFSLVVGFALILAGISGLSEFELPQAFLALLGLSQAIYVGGKAIAPPTMADFDRQLQELRALEGEAKAAEQKDKGAATAKVEEKLDQVMLAYRGITGKDPSTDPALKAGVASSKQRYLASL